jgi:hypothetical protein
MEAGVAYRTDLSFQTAILAQIHSVMWLQILSLPKTRSGFACIGTLIQVTPLFISYTLGLISP